MRTRMKKRILQWARAFAVAAVCLATGLGLSYVTLAVAATTPAPLEEAGTFRLGSVDSPSGIVAPEAREAVCRRLAAAGNWLQRRLDAHVRAAVADAIDAAPKLAGELDRRRRIAAALYDVSIAERSEALADEIAQSVSASVAAYLDRVHARECEVIDFGGILPPEGGGPRDLDVYRRDGEVREAVCALIDAWFVRLDARVFESVLDAANDVLGSQRPSLSDGFDNRFGRRIDRRFGAFFEARALTIAEQIALDVHVRLGADYESLRERQCPD